MRFWQNNSDKHIQPDHAKYKFSINCTSITAWLWENGLFSLIGLVLILGIKYIYRSADCNRLRWILTPTAFWAGILSGISFTWQPDIGYWNHSVQFIIASTCSGLQFMLVTAATLIFSFIHRKPTGKKKLLWIGKSFLLAYLYTIFINGIRIVLSIYLPVLLSFLPWNVGWINPEQLHTIIGIAVYFTALFAGYQAADRGMRWISPVFWYVFLVLGIPFLNHAYQRHGKKFTEYAAQVLLVCGIILGIWAAGTAVKAGWKKFGQTKNKSLP